MADRLSDISVIVPLAPGEDAWRGLARDLEAGLPRETEILFAGAGPDSRSPGEAARARWVDAGRAGRGRQLNAAARAARGRWLWFLHADSRLGPGAFDALRTALAAPDAERALHYFDLRFRDDGPRLMRVNETGAWVRSRFLGLPFGDQGLCLAREAFERLGGYREDAPYGEDHLLVWAARAAGLRVLPAGAAIETSARKYRERGWWRTTCRHGVLTWKQALPSFASLLARRGGP